MSCEIIWKPLDIWFGGECEHASTRWRGNSAGPDYLERAIGRELAEMDVLDGLIETDHQFGDYTKAGRPRSVAAAKSPRVQLWFTLDGTDICLPSAHFDSWLQNLKAIELTLERQRLIRGYGVASVKRQYAGFTALPESANATPTGKHAAANLLIRTSGINVSADQVISDPVVLKPVYRAAAANAHPDRGGSNDLMTQVNQAHELLKGGR